MAEEVKDYPELEGLSNRARNALIRANLVTREDIKEAFYSGEIMRFRNFGKTCLKSVEKWLNEEVKQAEIYNIRYIDCPNCKCRIKIKKEETELERRKRVILGGR